MTFRVQGRVVLKGSGSGIADLVICALDIDSLSLQKPSENANALFAGRAERLGSVLTDSEGRFLLAFGETTFANAEGKPARPDMVLLVLGPDRPTSSSDVTGLPLEQRLLFRSRVALVDSASIESILIQLERDQLQRAGLGLPPSMNETLAADAMRERLKHAAIERAALISVQREFVKPSLPDLVRERQVISGLMERLAFSASLFPRAGFLGVAVPPATVLDGVLTRWRDTLTRHRDRRVVMRVRLGDEDIRALGGDPTTILAGGSHNVTFCQLARRLGSDGSLLRNRDLMTLLRARRAVRRLSPSPEAPEPPPPPAEEPGEGTAELVRAEIFRRLRAQVAQLPDINPGSAGPVGDLRRIKEAVSQLEMSGPANVVASRDLNVLHIAFESVWTSVFDRSFERRSRELYRSLVRLDTDYGVGDGGLDGVTSAQELRRLLDDVTSSTSYASIEPIPVIVTRAFSWITSTQWNGLDPEGKLALMDLSERRLVRMAAAADRNRRAGPPPTVVHASGVVVIPPSPDDDRNEAERILQAHSNSPIARAEALIAEMQTTLAEPYRFSVFAEGTVNYGALLTYRLQCAPLGYQVGRLIRSDPLAPGESKEINIKQTHKRIDRHRRGSKQLSESSRETQATTRTEQEVLNATTMAINNRLSVEGQFNIGIGQIGATSEFSQNFTQESRRLQKNFGELARKASEALKIEVEVTSESEDESYVESTFKHVLANTNNEVTVTYLLYDLERRYDVASRLHRVQPVILVAMDMPNPDDVTEAWVLEHASLLLETLEEADLRPFFDQLGRTGDSVELELRRNTFLTQRRVTEALEGEFNSLAEQVRHRRQQIIRLMQGEGEARADEASDGERIAAAIFSGGFSELLGGGQSDDNERIESLRKAAEKSLEDLGVEMESKGAALARAQSALQEATQRFAEMIKQKAAGDMAVTRIRLYVKNNIFHVMHHYWMREHPDARYLRLYDREVPFFPPNSADYSLRAATAEERSSDIPGLDREGEPYVLEFVAPAPPASIEDLPRRKLGDIADLDRLLGFRGNYAIFPLRECCQVTDVMLHPFVDDYFGVRDPAYEEPYTGPELLAYAQEAWRDPDAALDDAARDRLARMVVEAMVRWPDAQQEIVLPTGQLFMEALKGDHTLLEPFKLAHRGLDVLKAEEEVLAMRLDTYRRLSRIARDELDIDPRSVEKFVVVQGRPGTVIEP